MLYSFINLRNIATSKKIKDIEKSILFNYCDSKIKHSKIVLMMIKIRW